MIGVAALMGCSLPKRGGTTPGQPNCCQRSVTQACAAASAPSPGDAHWRAVLGEARQVRGKTKQRHISYLVGFTESALAIPQQQRFIWDQIHQRLVRLSKRISREDRRRIEAALIEKIGKPPTKAQRTKLDRARKRWLGKLAKSRAKVAARVASRT